MICSDIIKGTGGYGKVCCRHTVNQYLFDMIACINRPIHCVKGCAFGNRCRICNRSVCNGSANIVISVLLNKVRYRLGININRMVARYRINLKIASVNRFLTAVQTIYKNLCDFISARNTPFNSCTFALFNRERIRNFYFGGAVFMCCN